MTPPVNPLHSRNKLKFGAFALNGDTTRRTTPPDHYRFNWENSLDVALQADEAGFEAIVPYARWRSVAQPNHYGSHVFDATNWGAAVAARTRTSAIMTTMHVTTVHPVMAAKMMTTIDHISGGRFALNIVCGWFEAEMKMFGQDLLPHDQRYAYADEWITAIKQMWATDEPVDFHGKYIKMDQGICFPKPLQKPHPLLMNAGGSADGRAFVAKHCDVAFISGYTFDLIKKEADGYRQHVRDTAGREVQIWMPCAVIQGDTMAQAQEIADAYMKYADQLSLQQAMQPGSPYVRTWDGDPDKLEGIRKAFVLAGGNYLLLGDGEYIAEQMQRLSAAGVDGLLMTWTEPQGGIRKFRNDVLPRLVAAGLREHA